MEKRLTAQVRTHPPTWHVTSLIHVTSLTDRIFYKKYFLHEPTIEEEKGQTEKQEEKVLLLLLLCLRLLSATWCSL